MSDTTNNATKASETPKRTIEEEVELAQKAFALKQYEVAVDHYATALELQTEKFGERAPENADLYFAYGKALLEHAVTQTSVLGKQGAEGGDGDDDAEPDVGGSTKGAFFSFSGDTAEDDGDDDDDEDSEDADDGAAPPDSDAPVDLFAEADKAVEAEDAAAAAAAEEEEGDDEPEDDFNAAWEILDLARVLFDQRKEESDEIKLKLADTHVALGDVSLETEKFDEAIADYQKGVELKTTLLPTSSRQLAEVHYKLSLVLDMTSGRLNDAIRHVEKALESTQARLDELRAALAGDAPTTEEKTTETTNDVKGKGKAVVLRLGNDNVTNLSKTQIEAEIKDIEELSADLKLKLEELAQPTDEAAAAGSGMISAPELVAQALDQELNAGSRSAVNGQSGKVNDLTGMVKKKKKVDTSDATLNTATGGKRKADDEATTPTEKRARVEETAVEAK